MNLKLPQSAMLCWLTIIQLSAQGDPVCLMSDKTTWQINPATLAVTARNTETSAVVEFSRPVITEKVSQLETSPEAASWVLPKLHLQIHLQRISQGGLQVKIAAGREQTLSWPELPLSMDDQMAWPLGEGLLFPVKDAFWQKQIFGREWPAAESLSLPLAGVARKNLLATWISETPLRHTVEFTTNTSAENTPAVMRVVQDFSSFSTGPLVMRFYLDTTTNPLTSARHFRDYLGEGRHLKTLEEKATQTTAVALLKGAPFVYIWGSVFSTDDILTQQWQHFCEELITGARSGKPVAAFLQQTFSAEQWQAVESATKEKWIYDYLKRQIAEGLSVAVVSEKFPLSEIDDSGSTLSEQAVILERCRLLAKTFPGVFRPVDQWGGGVSNHMLDLLSDAGLKQLRLCTAGQEALQLRPDVARNAQKLGWLIGTYDSYHSVHSPDMNPDETWATAQMTRDLFEHGAVVGADGKPLRGFKGLGRKLNPVIGRQFMEQRVTRNMESVPYNYYFIDCDATGEVFDDYSPAHRLSKESDITERMRRLRWINQRFGVVVGSEGGNAFAANSIAVAEGVFAPFFGWDDPAMKDRKSKFYRGAYYPPDEPAIFFKPIPLSDEHRKLYFDPACKLPLYATALHDCVEVSAHWNNGHFKYEGLDKTRELLDLLYLAPPLYHLNAQEFAKRKAAIVHFYETWSPLHQNFGFAELRSFEVLTADRMVQRAVYVNSAGDDCEIRVNFAARPFAVPGGQEIPADGALIDAPSVWDAPRVYVMAK